MSHLKAELRGQSESAASWEMILGRWLISPFAFPWAAQLNRSSSLKYIQVRMSHPPCQDCNLP